MASNLIETAARVAASGRITADDALALRRQIFAEMEVTASEAEALIDLDETAAERSPEWTALFLEALTLIIVHQHAPAGYVDEAQADWLMATLKRDGRIKTDSELELLVRILEAATTAPSRLVAFALAQVKAAVVDGRGPLLRGGACEPGRITAGEADLLRRILYAAAGDDDLAITRQEAELLFDINDACRGSANDPAWTDLFAKAIAASVMTVSGYTPPDRETAARREAWLTEGPSVGGFIGRMFSSAGAMARRPDARSALESILHPSDGLDDWRAKNAADEAISRAAEVVSADEAAWLAARIGRDGVYDAAERAVIDFLRRESPSIDPALRPLLDA